MGKMFERAHLINMESPLNSKHPFLCSSSETWTPTVLRNRYHQLQTPTYRRYHQLLKPPFILRAPSSLPPTPQTTYLSPTSQLSTLPPTPITTQDIQDSQQQQQDSQLQNEIKRKTYRICKQWLGIAWIVFVVIATASEIGIKILKNPTPAKCLRIIYFALEAIHIYMVHKILRKGHELPIKKKVQIFVMLVICGGFTAAIMFMIAVDSPFEKWGFIGPLVSGCVWFIRVLPLISHRVPMLPL